MTLDERYQAVQTRLTSLRDEAAARLASPELAEHRVHNVALRAMARDVHTACTQALSHLSSNEASVREAEEWAHACEETLKETPETMAQKLRAAADEPTLF